MAVTSFNIDTKLDNTLETLKIHYGAASKAEVLRKAIALLNVVSRNENKDGSITIRHNNEDIKVILR